MRTTTTLALLVLSLLFTACTPSDERVRSVLAANSLKLQRTTGYELWACGKDDGLNTGFVATNATGATVRGVLCCGYVFKACTVRFE